MKKNQKLDKESHILVLGELDIILKIDFKDEDLEIKPEDDSSIKKGGPKKYYKFRHLNEISSLSFLQNNNDIINRIQLTSKKELIKLLLIGNRNSEKKSIIDYICFGAPIFEKDELFFNSFLDSITKKYGIIFNKKPLNINAGYSIKIEMTYGSQKKEILVESEGRHEHEEDNDIKEEGDSPQDDNNILEDDFDEDYHLNEAMIKNLIPKFRRRNMLCNMYPLFNKYDMLYFNFEDLNKISKNFKIEYMLELIDFFKKKKSIIFVNYYMLEKDKEKIDNNPKKDEKIPSLQIKSSKRILTKEEYLEIINRFYYVTDVYFFDKKQSIKNFNDHYNLFTTDDSKKIISSRNVYDYFIKGIATGTENEVPNEKTGIFLDEFNEFCIIHVNKNNLVEKEEYDPHPFPKINTHNIKEVSIYKDIIKKNKNDFYSLFLSELVISISHNSNYLSISPLIIYPSYLTGMDLIKKKIECIKNGVKIDENDEKFYKIKKHPKIISQELDKITKGEKEGKFLLDCTNKITSNKKEYISLFDFHLRNYFSNQYIRKDLENKGFIDSKGYILYDPVYKNTMANKMKKKKLNEEQMKEKIISDINNIKMHSVFNGKNVNDINILMKNNFNITSDIKIPFIKDENIQSQNVNKKKANNKNEFGLSKGYKTGINYKKGKNIYIEDFRKTK